ncbi:MAG: oxidoreductase, partial [Endozoicomonas sp.]
LEPARPLEKQLWAGCIDTVGSKVLAKVLAQVDYQGAVAACGLAGGFDLPTTVMPFILRGVKLLGVDSVMCPTAKRTQAWDRLVELLPESSYNDVSQEVGLEAVSELAEAITNGQVTGRTLIRL